ncbi:MAG TPA: hypothetical protein VFE77_00215, partial [Rhodanobacter sp.]|nr:hypothetical protein [Rhodanobacter sp.]
NPLIGRPASNGKCELVIGNGLRGYLALYRYVESLDIVFVLAVHAQREAGFARCPTVATQKNASTVSVSSTLMSCLMSCR